MMNLLWLPAWYPNRIEPFTGDFLQRHARAVSLYHQVRVINIVRDKEGAITRQVHRDEQETFQLKETTIYYYSPSFIFKPAEKLLSSLRYRKLYRRAIKAYLEEEGPPAAVHVHIAGKNGWMALWLKRRFGIPYVITEHWGGYLTAAKPNFSQLSLLLRWMWRKVMKKAAGISVVSRHLGYALEALQPGISFSVIPNVVDSNLFYPLPAATRKGPFQFIHISTLTYQKNPEDIFRAFALVKQTSPAFRLSVFGPPAPALRQLAVELGLQDEIQFHEEVPQRVLAGYLRQADALILYSRYETFGCVLIEANACGIPAIVSDLAVHHETIQEGVNGYFAEGENAVALAQKINWFMQEADRGSKEAIAVAARVKYNYERIGQLFTGFYTGHIETK